MSFRVRTTRPRHNLSLLTIDIIIVDAGRKNVRTEWLAFIHFSITGCSMEAHFQRSHDPRRKIARDILHPLPSIFATNSLSVPAKSNERGAREEEFLPYAPPRVRDARRFFNLRILSFSREEFHSSGRRSDIYTTLAKVSNRVFGKLRV